MEPTTSPAIQYSIIIRAFNEEEHIGKLLTGISEQTVKEQCEVILVDSGSTDATCKIAQQFQVKIVKIKPEEFSFGSALNIGCAAAKGNILIFASAHVYPVYDNWIEEMVKPLSKSNIALCYGRQVGNEVTKFSEEMVFRKWFPEESDFEQAHPFCNNANVAIRRELWEQYPYDETLTGLEDLGWAKNIIAQGWKIAYNAQAVIVHVHNETPAKTRNRYRREAIAMKNIFPEADFSFWSFLRLFTANTFSDWVAAGKQGKFIRHFRSIISFRLMQFWGTYEGYAQSKKLDNQLLNRFYYPNGIRSSSKSETLENHKIDYSGSQAEMK